MFSMIKNLLKMLTSKKVLVVLAIIAVTGGAYLYWKSQKAVVVQSDVDQESSVEQEIVESVMSLTPETIELETQDLGQAPMPIPAVPATTETTESFEVVGLSTDSDNYSPLV